MDAIQNEETYEMLCPDVLSWESAMDKKSAMGADIFSANYRQIPIDLMGRLYQSFKTYDKLPVDEKGNLLFDGIYSYTDTADEGEDYLCSIIWGAYNKEAYVLDVIYTQKPMQETEPMVANALTKHKVNRARFESNNGGSGMARNVIRILNDLNNVFTVVKWFHQGKNKQARILSNATWVMEHIYYPKNWMDRWPEYYESMIKYQREGKNAHDDAEDATTGVAETMYMMGA